MGGWWWGGLSPSTSTSSPSANDRASFAKDEPSTSTKDKPLSRDEQSLADLRTLFTSIDPDRAAAASAAVKTRSDDRARAIAAGEDDEDEDSLYPTTMKCAGCFDQAYYCSSLGGQLTNIYRYGGMRSCSDLWAQWRFCMRTKAMGGEERKDRIKEWEQRKVIKYKVGKSSEDVWAVREQPIDHPFAKDLDRGDEADVVLKGQC
ncbi:hypothetical protein FH972_026053 [Carpinus fangiana]|uniref:Uncharacterized protein n=1 Tax=Carpinus fangiana TaxID=176857 RepID=A0A5N6L369_9ROSI|nr:hypothetical protein FH972_026053 [Carpinus fangiana]